MPKNHKPKEVPRNDAKSSDSHRCAKSPTGSHWWKIEPYKTVTSVGICQYCEESREFINPPEVVAFSVKVSY